MSTRSRSLVGVEHLAPHGRRPSMGGQILGRWRDVGGRDGQR